MKERQDPIPGPGWQEMGHSRPERPGNTSGERYPLSGPLGPPPNRLDVEDKGYCCILVERLDTLGSVDFGSPRDGTDRGPRRRINGPPLLGDGS